MPWLSHSLIPVSIPKIILKKGKSLLSREGETKNNKLFSVKAKKTRYSKQQKKRKEDVGTRIGERPVRRVCSM